MATAGRNDADAKRAQIAKALDEARRHLVETGSRNRLIHTPRANRRTRTIEIVDELSDEVFRILVRDERTMRFRAAERVPNADGDAEDDGDFGLYTPPSEASGEEGGAEQPARRRDAYLQTTLTPEGLQKRLMALQRDARTLEEEQGINILFLALGFLRWYESDSSETLREAPLVLVPVVLQRDSARSSYRIAVREDDIATNLSLQEMLRGAFGIALPEIPDDDTWKPSDYFAAVRRAVASQRRWSVDDDGMLAGLFSFSKLLMFRDLVPESWPEDAMAAHPLLRGLLAEGFAPCEPLFPETGSLDRLLDTTALPHVLDADSSQALVIETIRRGRNLVVQGPPGTGKSQTIANIIAAAVNDGKSVLFVAEKMAALQVVHGRLARAGLDRVCLELHSRKANKLAVVNELRRTLEAARPAAPPPAMTDDRLRALRDQLNDASDALHRPLAPSGVAPFRALGEQVELRQRGHPPPSLTVPGIETLTEARMADVLGAIEQLAALTERWGPLERHPWYGVRAAALQPTDRERLVPVIARLGERLAQLAAAVRPLWARFALSAPPTLADVPKLGALLGLLADRGTLAPGLLATLGASAPLGVARNVVASGEALAAARVPVAETFVEAAWRAELGAIRAAIATSGPSFFRRLGPRYRRARRELAALLRRDVPSDWRAQLALLDAMADAQAKRAAFERLGTSAGTALGAHWQGEQTDLAALSAGIAWIDRVLALGLGVAIAQLAPLEIAPEPAREAARALAALHDGVTADLASVDAALALDPAAAFASAGVAAARLDALETRGRFWCDAMDRLDDWLALRAADAAVRAAHPPIAEALARGSLAPTAAVAEARYGRAEALWKQAIGERPLLASLAGDSRSRDVAAFRDLDAGRRSVAAAEIVARHAGTLPWGEMGEMGVIRGELARKRGHLPLRKLVAQAGTMLQRIKPVFLMSPLSVAQFLPPGAVRFDLLVMDEASQIRPEDALGAIARADQVAVVGDKRQLPPTSFFDRVVAEDGAEDGPESDDGQVAPPIGVLPAAAAESILTLCEAQAMANAMLTWHYRSRHPSLIEVSNDEFYDNKLFLPPSPQAAADAQGFLLKRVPGAYDRGGKRTNRVEADALVEAAARHARRCPGLSLGIVTFSLAQRDLIDALLEQRRRADPALDAALRETQREPLFVKNLENVQGDERDVILVSVAYGPRIAGARLDSMAFGPVSADGGERRLNVLFTRARHRCEVFASFDPDDIDLDRATQRGPRVLKRFLRYAATGQLDLPAATGRDADSPFEEAVAREIAAMGYPVDQQVGSAGFRIDLAVRDPARPGRYLLAVECDGATYHAARWARERDRLRQEVLEGLGWSVHRIWSTDWFRNPVRETQRLRDVLAAAQARADVPVAPTPSEPTSLAPSDPQPEPQPEPEPERALPPPAAAAVPGTVAYREASFAVESGADMLALPVAALARMAEQVVAAEGPVHQDEVARRLARLFGKERTGSRIAEAVLRALHYAETQTRTIAATGSFWRRAGAQGPVPVRDRSDATGTLLRAEMLPPDELRSAVALAIAGNGAISRAELGVATARLLGFRRTGPDIRDAIDRIVRTMIDDGGLREADGRVRQAD